MANIENNYAADHAIQVNAPIVGNDLTLNYLSTKSEEEKYQQCRDALFLTDQRIVREHLIDTKGQRVAGTCEWITENEHYRSWLSCEKQLLWISGGPGKGKTMLSIFLTKELEKVTEHKKDATLLYFFCSHQDSRLNSAVAILRGLLYQIITKHPHLIKHVAPHFDGPNTIHNTVSSAAALWITLERCLQDTATGTIFCILDGLDECEGISSLVAKFVNLSSRRDSSTIAERFQLAVSSRDVSGLAGFTRLKLDPDSEEQVNSDIQLFISAKIDEISKIEGFNEDIRAHIQRTLLKHAEGTFLWVGFLMNELCQKKTCVDLLETLHDFPKGLDAVYRRMLLQIENHHRKTASAILRWVMLAFRPLTLKELAAAISLKSHALVNNSQAIRDHITWCGAFLKIRDDEVGLVHQSAQDYLLREYPNENTWLKQFGFNADIANLEIAQICFSYIQNSPIAKKPLKLDDAEFQDFPLLNYAVINWADHLRDAENNANDFDQSDTFFYRSSDLRINWWQTLSELVDLKDLCRTFLPPLHIAAYFGILSWVQKLLKKSSLMKLISNPANEKDSKGWTALMWAALGDQEDVMQLLVDHGANVNVMDSTKENTALLLAIKGDNKVPVQLLLESGANTNINYHPHGWTALHLTSIHGDNAIIQLLVDHGANINAIQCAKGQAPLHLAALFGKAATVQLLLSYGVNVNVRSSDHGFTALFYAAIQGHEATVQVLLDHGADIDMKDFDGFTALHLAVKQENEVLVQLLLDHGADVNIRGYDNDFTALYSAVLSGHPKIVLLLLNYGADINKRYSKDGYTTLHISASQGQEDLVQLLLDHGADKDMKDCNGLTALQVATVREQKRVMQLLVEHGTDSGAKRISMGGAA